MSKTEKIPAITAPLSSAWNWCKRVACKLCQVAAGANPSTTDGRPEYLFEIARHATINQVAIELKECLTILSIGDRIRLFCDDGILILEKISQTQVKVVHSQPMAELVH